VRLATVISVAGLLKARFPAHVTGMAWEWLASAISIAKDFYIYMRECYDDDLQ